MSRSVKQFARVLAATEKEMRDAETPRTPESLSRLEKSWLRRRYCGWCEAPVDTNTCFCMYGDKCTDKMLNERRGRWLAEDYKPRGGAK